VIEHESGILDATVCVQTIIRRFQRLGGELISGIKIDQIEPKDNKFRLTASNGRTFSADRLVLACGPWMNSVLKNLGLVLPLRPVRMDVTYWRVKERRRFLVDIFCTG